jgi:hypothetical protein
MMPMPINRLPLIPAVFFQTVALCFVQVTAVHFASVVSHGLTLPKVSLITIPDFPLPPYELQTGNVLLILHIAATNVFITVGKQRESSDGGFDSN